MKRVILTILSLGLLLAGCSKEQTQTNNITSKENAEETSSESSSNTSKKIILPYQLGNGEVVIQSLFDSDIMNVDADDEEGTSIASLEITNESEKFIQHATIKLTMSDEQIYTFVIEDLPAHESMWVFNQDNLSHQDATITSIDYQADYLDLAPLHQGEIQIDVLGEEVTLTNLTNQDINNITVTCHAKLETTIYGGRVYQYDVQSLPANQSMSFEAYDCFLDGAMVVELTY